MVMLSVNEEVQILNIRVFKWNEELHNVESSQGLFLFRIIDNILRNSEFHQRTLKRPELLSVLRIKNKLSVFELVNLSNRDSIKKLVSQAIESREEDYLDDTAAKLREAVSEYLLGCFKFDIFQPLPSLKNPIIVIVVDVAVSKRINGTRKRHLPSSFLSKRQETKDSCDDVSTKDSCDDASMRPESVKKRRVGDARAYKKEIRSRMQQLKLSHRDEVEIRLILRSYLEEPRASVIIPIVAGEPKGLSQVEVAVKEKEFDGNELEDACPICLEGILRGMKVAKSPCSHIFHRDCLFRWLPKDSRCPLCRSTCATLVSDFYVVDSFQFFLKDFKFVLRELPFVS
ncbi:uncharacterized protein LOC131300022 isoform X1 [Rhododendron vialii]|uniref:uncharacterized protein LOC131300022 isoform X1 n=1 Tax=Rhododendron vialii TaxID=182163 RepID=UPI00265EB3E9|nr:uncharacterized protein LOC131300022 isoform X1 [Rhododendron vialii]